MWSFLYSVWDLRQNKIVRELQTQNIVTSIEVLPDSTCIVTADGKDAKFWDGASLSLKKVYTQPYTVESVSFCPEKNRFVQGGEDMWVHLHDFLTGEEIECNRGETPILQDSCLHVGWASSLCNKGPPSFH